MDINDNLVSIIDRYKNNKLSQSNLIVTDDVEKCLSELIYVVKNILCSDSFSCDCDKCNVCHLIDDGNLSNFVIIRPDGASIRKEQISDLMNKFLYKPELVAKNIYIILEAEKLNNSSSNTMLKFIEEPDDDNIGFLITSNASSLLPTIISRCQKFIVNYNCSIDVDYNLKDLAHTFIDSIENDYYNSLLFIKDSLLNKDFDKNTYISIMNVILDVYYNSLLNVINEDNYDDSFDYLIKLGYDKLNKKVQIINKYIDRLNYNVNMNLFFDNFVSEMR